MTELEKLKQQKREIERKIRELTSETKADGACLKVEHFNTGRPSEWSIMLDVLHILPENTKPSAKTFRTSIIKSVSKEEAIEAIPRAIEALMNLHWKLTGKGLRISLKNGKWHMDA